MNEENSNATESRRDFLSKLIMGGGLLASSLLLIRHGLAFIFPKMKPPTFRKLLVGRIGELETGQAKEFEIGGQTLFLVNTPAGYKVFSGVCTHLGCKVKWQAHNDRFYCPCHQGVFAASGEVRSGPPPRPLDEFRVETENSLIYMYLEQKRQRGVV